VFGQRKSEVGQRRPPAARFGRSWSAGVFARVHGQGAPSGMGFDRKVMALRVPGRPESSARKLGVDASAELLGAERFRDVVLRAELEASIDVGVLTARGEQDDPRGGGCRVGS